MSVRQDAYYFPKGQEGQSQFVLPRLVRYKVQGEMCLCERDANNVVLLSVARRSNSANGLCNVHRIFLVSHES